MEHMAESTPAVHEDPQRHLGYLIRRAQQLHVATWARLASPDTTSVQYSILAVLDSAGEASQRELCDEVDLDRSTVADLLMRMERRGLVARDRDSRDRRRNAVSLTDAGREELVRLVPRVEQVQTALAEHLSAADATRLDALLRQMLA